MKKSNEVSLGEAISEFLKRNKLDEKLMETEIYARWEELVGRSVNLKTQSVQLKNGSLVVKITSSVLRKELAMRKSAILEQINMRLMGRYEISDIRFM